jgi:hypothetical protein
MREEEKRRIIIPTRKWLHAASSIQLKPSLDNRSKKTFKGI